MKKLLFIILIIFIAAFGMTLNGIGADKPQYGGVLRVIEPMGPQVLSYVPEMGPGDHSMVFPAGERLMETTGDKMTAGVEPFLAESVDDDAENMRITWHLRKGVKFHDGTEMDAEVVKWNFQQIIDANALPHQEVIKEMKVVDKYTLVMELNDYSNQLVPDWGFWPVITSKAAYDKASGGDPEKGKEWARSHIVGTGPFILKEWKRDVHLIWEKNPNYWQKGRPYLDSIEVRFIPDPVTASAMMQAKEADAWNTSAKYQKELMSKGFVRQSSWPALGWCIWINTAHPDSKWMNKKLRESVEYAIDKAAIAKALGYGLYKPLKSLPPEGEWGYDPNYNPRPYNPEKARQLLKEAGYPKGLKIKLLTPVFMPDAKDAGTAIKQFLEDVGFQVDLDLADPGRFAGAVYVKAPGPDQDLAWWFSGRDSNYLQSYMRWFSTEPFTDLAFLGHTPEQAEMDKKAQKLTDVEEMKAMAQKCTHYLTDNALIIPVYDQPVAIMQQPWVHSDRYEQGFTRWKTGEVWMEKH